MLTLPGKSLFSIKFMQPELIDIVDQAGNPLGYSRPRDEVHKTGLWHKTVHIWVLNSKQQLLLQKR
ncbi:MAG TPA: hypothetical protein VF335_05955, partial [Chitinivibrionales bacterium]